MYMIYSFTNILYAIFIPSSRIKIAFWLVCRESLASFPTESTAVCCLFHRTFLQDTMVNVVNIYLQLLAGKSHQEMLQPRTVLLTKVKMSNSIGTMNGAPSL